MVIEYKGKLINFDNTGYCKKTTSGKQFKLNYFDTNLYFDKEDIRDYNYFLIKDGIKNESKLVELVDNQPIELR